MGKKKVMWAPETQNLILKNRYIMLEISLRVDSRGDRVINISKERIGQL